MMYMVHVKNQTYGPFSYYKSAVEFARQQWAEKNFYITGPHSDEIPV